MDLPNIDELRPLRVAGFTFNTESVRFCNGRTDPDSECVRDLFVTHLLDLRLGIAAMDREKRPDVVVIALQESAADSGLMNGINSAVVKALANRGYRVPGEPPIAEAMGYGLTTFTKGTKRGLRLGIFVNEDMLFGAALDEAWAHFCGSSPSLDSRPKLRNTLKSKGGLVRSLELADQRKLTFVSVHLPFTSSSFATCSQRLEALEFQSACFDRLYEEVLAKEDPDYLFLMGDMNYRLSPFEFDDADCSPKDQVPRVPEEILRMLESIIEMENAQSWSPLSKLDELLARKQRPRLPAGGMELSDVQTWMARSGSQGLPLRGLGHPKEGVDNRGPEFAPTCKMCKGRPAGCPEHGSGQPLCDSCAKKDGECQVCYAVRQGNDPRQLGWCDRILYSSLKNDIRCTEYDRYDHGNMVKSDHAGVIGIYELGEVLVPSVPIRFLGRL